MPINVESVRKYLNPLRDFEDARFGQQDGFCDRMRHDLNTIFLNGVKKTPRGAVAGSIFGAFVSASTGNTITEGLFNGALIGGSIDFMQHCLRGYLNMAVSDMRDPFQ